MMQSAGLPSINVRWHKIASSRNGADSERRYQVSHARFQAMSNDVINAHALFELRFWADLESLKDGFLLPSLKLRVTLDVQGPHLDELDHGGGAMFGSGE